MMLTQSEKCCSQPCRFCSPTFTNSSGIVGATLTYPTFTLTLATGACALTNDFTPNPDNPYDNWLNTKGFVCKTPELSFKQVSTQPCLRNLPDSFLRVLMHLGKGCLTYRLLPLHE